MCRLAAWLGCSIVACEAAPVAEPAPAPIETASPLEIPPERRCGEAGLEPTPLPPMLAEGPGARCPEVVTFDIDGATRSLWVSSTGIRAQTLDPSREMVSIAMIDFTGTPMIQLVTIGHELRLPATPGLRRRVRLGRHIVAIDEVVTVAGGTHARVGIEASPLPVEVMASAGVGCGEPALARTTVPPELARAVPIVDELHLQPGDSATTADIELALSSEVSPIFEGHELRIGGPVTATPASVPLPEHTRTQLVRVGRTTLRIDPSDDVEVRVRRMKLGCPTELAMPLPQAPTTFWLSTHGRDLVTIGTPTRLTLRLFADPLQPTLQAAVVHGLYSRPLTPSIAGDVMGFGEMQLEVLDVVATGGTRFDGHAWQSAAAMPAIHVQVRVTPTPG